MGNEKKTSSFMEKTANMMQVGGHIAGSVVEKSTDAVSEDKGTSKTGIGFQESSQGVKDKILATAEKYENIKAVGSYTLEKHKNNKEASKRIKESKRETKKAFDETKLAKKAKEGKSLTASEKATLDKAKSRMKRFNKETKKAERSLAKGKNSEAFLKNQKKKRKRLEHLENAKELTNYGQGNGQGVGMEENLQDFAQGTVAWASKGIANRTLDAASAVRKSKLEHGKAAKKADKTKKQPAKSDSKHINKSSRRTNTSIDNKQLSKGDKHNLQKKNLQKRNARKLRKGDKNPISKFKALGKNKDIKAAIFGIAGPILAIIGIIVIMFLLLSAIATCIGGVGQHTSYQAEDETLLLSNKEFVTDEKNTKNAINNTETDHPTASNGNAYDEYIYRLNGTETSKDVLVSKIEHDGNLIASYLTAKYFNYTLTEEIKNELHDIYDEVFKLSQYETIETKTGYGIDPETGIEYIYFYDYAIFNTDLETKDLDEVLKAHLDTEEQLKYYELYKDTSGQKDYLFGGYTARDDIYRYEYDYDEYVAIYGEADISFSDVEAQQIYNVAQTQLGKAYKWGGSKPSTGFDCSGYVYWVLNTSGVASFPRTSANVILETYCDRVTPAEAKPGDLIFFQGTYATRGASHVGIYLGNNQMIHCGDPIKITNISTNYWTTHFYTYGRIKSEYR